MAPRPKQLAALTILMCLLNPTGFLMMGESEWSPYTEFFLASAMIAAGYSVLWYFWLGHRWAGILVQATSVLALFGPLAWVGTPPLGRAAIIAEAVLGAYLLYWWRLPPVRAYFAPREPTNQRRPWLAALLSSVAGLGHVYAGAPKRAAVWLIADVVFALILVVVLVYAAAWWWAVGAVSYTAFRIAMAASAWRVARYPADPPGPVDRPWLFVVCLAYCGGVALVSTGFLRAARRIAGGDAWRVASLSMAPTLEPGDYIFSRVVEPGSVGRDDIVAYKHGEQSWVHRVVGLAGDTLSMRSGTLFRNGTPVAEPYASVSDRSWGPQVIPQDSVFVLGDNRADTLLSLRTSVIARTSITQRPYRVYFSISPDYEIRWSRIGMELRTHRP